MVILMQKLQKLFLCFQIWTLQFFVIKKNVPVLSNILVWLNSQPGIKYDPKVPWTWNGLKITCPITYQKIKLSVIYLCLLR